MWVLGGEESHLLIIICSRAFNHCSEIFMSKWQASTAASPATPHLILLKSCLYISSQDFKHL